MTHKSLVRPEIVEAARLTIRRRRVRDNGVSLIISSGEILQTLEERCPDLSAHYSLAELRRLVTIAMLNLGAAPYARGQGRQCGRTFVVPPGVAV